MTTSTPRWMLYTNRDTAISFTLLCFASSFEHDFSSFTRVRSHRYHSSMPAHTYTQSSLISHLIPSARRNPFPVNNNNHHHNPLLPYFFTAVQSPGEFRVLARPNKTKTISSRETDVSSLFFSSLFFLFFPPNPFLSSETFFILSHETHETHLVILS